MVQAEIQSPQVNGADLIACLVIMHVVKAGDCCT